MKRIFFSYLLTIIALGAYAQGFGKRELINREWKFMLEHKLDNGLTSRLNQEWQTVDIPHDWSVKGELNPTLASSTGYLPGGIGVYEKDLDIPANSAGKKIYLYFEGVYNRSEVSLNGHLLGKRPNGYISFMYDATPYIKFGEKNTLTVRVDHSQNADSRWYTGSGIYRNVWLLTANPIHIAQWGVFAYPKDNKLNISVEIQNETTQGENLTIVNTLFDAMGKVVGKSTDRLKVSAEANGEINSSIQVRNPKLWNIDTPILYTLKSEVFKGKELLDTFETKTGFRTLKFDPNKGFYLNGENIKVKGVCLHHDAGVLGSAVPKEVWRRRMITLKSLGCNAIRTSHNPQSTDFYDLCDELGLLVMNEAYDEWEFAKRKWVNGWNQGVFSLQGSYDIFKDWSDVDLADFVRRDRNHISIFAWSIGNEVDYPNDPYSHPVLDGGGETGFTQPVYGGYQKDAPSANRLSDISKRLVATVKKYDTSRPVTAGLAGVAMSNETQYPEALDIAGYNYTESRYQIDHEKYPNRVIYGSENRHDYKPWCHVANNDYIFGQFIWTGIDYLGESGAWPSRGFYSGLLDFGGFVKPRGYFRQALWCSEPMAYIGTYHAVGDNDNDVWSRLQAKQNSNNNKPSMDAWSIWNYNDGEQIRVVCYTNCESARLMLNGSEVGKKKNYNTQFGIISWDIQYVEGVLTVEAFDKDDKLSATYSITSTGLPYKLEIDKQLTVVDENSGLAQIVVNIVDENGRKVMLADNEITCQIIGKAKLLGLEGSNNIDMSSYTDNKHRAYMGQLLSYIQLEGKEEVRVRFSSPLLGDIIVDL